MAGGRCSPAGKQADGRAPAATTQPPPSAPPLSSRKERGRPSSTLSWLVSTRPLGVLGRRRPMRSPSVPPAGRGQAQEGVVRGRAGVCKPGHPIMPGMPDPQRAVGSPSRPPRAQPSEKVATRAAALKSANPTSCREQESGAVKGGGRDGRQRCVALRRMQAGRRGAAGAARHGRTHVPTHLQPGGEPGEGHPGNRAHDACVEASRGREGQGRERHGWGGRMQARRA